LARAFFRRIQGRDGDLRKSLRLEAVFVRVSAPSWELKYAIIAILSADMLYAWK
jgi:hypothetical protein